MIVCHCNVIDHAEIEATASRISMADPWQLITPVAVYKALGKRPRCGGCLPLAANIIHTRDVRTPPTCSTCPLADPLALGVVSADRSREPCDAAERRRRKRTTPLFHQDGRNA